MTEMFDISLFTHSAKKYFMVNAESSFNSKKIHDLKCFSEMYHNVKIRLVNIFLNNKYYPSDIRISYFSLNLIETKFVCIQF